MSWYSNLWKFLVEREIKCLNKKIIITEFYLNLWISMVKRMVNFAKCCHTDITLLVLDVLQMKTSVIAPKISFWCLWNTPVSLIPRMVPALQWDTLITGWVSDWWVTFSHLLKLMITSPLKKEIQNECHTHLLCLRAVRLDIFVTHIKAQLSVMSIAMSIYVMALVSYFWGGKNKKAV